MISVSMWESKSEMGGGSKRRHPEALGSGTGEGRAEEVHGK